MKCPSPPGPRGKASSPAGDCRVSYGGGALWGWPPTYFVTYSQKPASPAQRSPIVMDGIQLQDDAPPAAALRIAAFPSQ